MGEEVNGEGEGRRTRSDLVMRLAHRLAEGLRGDGAVVMTRKGR